MAVVAASQLNSLAALMLEKRLDRKKKKTRHPSKTEDQASKRGFHVPTYLLPLALISFKVGCHVEHSLHRLQAALNKQYFPKWNILKYFFN
jgi:hypothetical protein